MTKLPPSASVAHGRAGDKLHAPSAERNRADICNLLINNAPKQGNALEIASGTGQHITDFAAALPRLHWQPTDVAPDRLASIDAYAADAHLPNIAKAKALDATAPDWAASVPPQDLIVVVNLLHLISADAVRALIEQSAQALTIGGRFFIYGPFKRDGALTSQGDARFDAELRAANPEIGYKDDAWIKEMLAGAGLRVTLVQDMPANNLAIISDRITS